VSNRDAAVLLFVGLGLLAAINSIAYLQATVVFGNAGGISIGGRLFLLVPTLFLAWAAVQLVRNRSTYAERLFPVESQSRATATAHEWQQIGVVIVGFMVLLFSIPELLMWAADLASEGRGQPTAWREATGNRAWSLSRALPALADPLLAFYVLVQRDEIIARLFPPRPPAP
jgi:hypothetical protein